MKKPFVIGIAGGSSSGKTTLALSLEKAWNGNKLYNMHMDHYFKPEDQLPVSEAPFTKKKHTDFNMPSSFYLSKLKEDLDKVIAIGKFDIIILEGLFTLWDKDIRDKLDLKLYVESRADERAVRRLNRNINEWGHTFDHTAEVYLDLVRYRHDEYVEPSKWFADIILNGSAPYDKALEVIIMFLNGIIKKT